MHFEFVVSAEVERVQGKFATRDELEEQILEALDSANPDSLEGSEGGEYEVQDWNVEAQAQRPRGKAKEANLGKGSVDSRPLGEIPELKVLAKAWYWMNQKPDDEKVQKDFEYAMEQAFQLITG
jgi:hypothetical protein